MCSGGKGYLRFEVKPVSTTTTNTNTTKTTNTKTNNDNSNENSIPGHQIHTGVTCDECGQSPIIGLRFKCSVRSNFDLCQNCETKSIQPFPMVKYYQPVNPGQSTVTVETHPTEKSCRKFEKAKCKEWKEWKEKKHRVRCDGCGVKPISGIRYKCTHRPDYDLCSDCESKNPIQPYPMIKIYSPDQVGGGIQVTTQGKNPDDVTIELDIDVNNGMKILRSVLEPTTTWSPWRFHNESSTSASSAPSNSTSSTSSNEIPIHRFVRCNECGMKPITGYRYKCTVRDDYDLCSSCESKIPQPYPMIKIYNPEQNSQHQGRGFGRGFGRGWHSRCGGRWRAEAAERAQQHFSEVVREKAVQQEKEAMELEEDLISATLEQSIASGYSTNEESKSSTESLPQADAFIPSAPILATATIASSSSQSHTSHTSQQPSRNIISKPMARFVRDVTMPDGTNVQPLSTFMKTWRIRNDGNQSWPEGCFLVNAGGDSLFSGDELRIPVASVHPGEEVDLSVSLTAPSASGRHVGYFRLQDNEGNWFGQRLWSDIRVNEVEDNLWQVVTNDDDDNTEEVEEPIPSQQIPIQPQTPIQIPVQFQQPEPPTDVEIWAKELEILASMGFFDLSVLIPLLRTHVQEPAGPTRFPAPEKMQAVVLALLSSM
eukprot:CAMPEP_0174818428 /NCGR_PEP_ID=MMETSP1107-20130205/1094_1 /TAXON_ID=36770 /ORGANISM="Paraphysomonas vestita, Strain GFlagA" /LENGTH=653 /DNA_ID=CAMNT_0016030239 /DNA_START=274 /DNA_END=2235 /DNA_ORIENTATION=+